MREIIRGMTATSWALVAVLVLVLITLGWCSYDANQKRRTEAARVEANAESVVRDVAVKETAADERLADALDIATTKQELSDAVSKLPDATPSARRLALACERLRRQGLRAADLPAICRHESTTQAGSQP